MNSNRGRFVITVICAIVVPLLVITFVITSCDTSSTTLPSASTTVDYDASDDLAEEVISSVIYEKNFSNGQLSYMNLVYNPYTKEVGDGLIIFPKEVLNEGACTLYLFGIDNPKDIEVDGWYMIGKTVLDTGLVKLIVTNQGMDGSTIPEGNVLLDGREIIQMR